MGADLSGAQLLIALSLSPFVGSFLAVLTTRLPLRQSIVWSRSRCDSCGHRLAVADLIPVVSWLCLRGRCRYCRQPIGYLPVAMELSAFVVVVWAAAETAGWILIASSIFGWALLCLAFTDARSLLLPDEITLPLIPVGLWVTYRIDPTMLGAHVFAALICFCGLVALAWTYRRLRGRAGLGMGDAKLLAALGAWLGPFGVPTAILFAAALGLAFALYRSLAGRPLALSDKLPLGTFLAVGGWLVWLYGPLVPAA